MSDWFVCPDGTRLHLVESGDPDARATIVLVHCYALDLRVWDPVVEQLSAIAGVRLLRYDQRGHGRSDAATSTTGVAQLGDDLAVLIAERVPTGPVVLVGHSMGGMAVMAMADRHPGLVEERVAGVAFLATSSSDMHALSLGLPRPFAAAASLVERVGMGVLAALGDGRLPFPAAVLTPFTRWLGFGSDARTVDVDAVSALVTQCRLGGVGPLRRTFDEHDCRLALITFDQLPALVVVGDEDRVTPVRQAAVIARWLPHARLVVFPGAGHMLLHERTGPLVGLLTDLVEDALALWSRAVATGWRVPA